MIEMLPANKCHAFYFTIVRKRKVIYVEAIAVESLCEPGKWAVRLLLRDTDWEVRAITLEAMDGMDAAQKAAAELL